jgi:CheY-like chemotaxis protein
MLSNPTFLVACGQVITASGNPPPEDVPPGPPAGFAAAPDTQNNEPARGGTFQISLSSGEGSPGAVEPSPGQTTFLRGTETILLVEDEPAVRSTTRLLLRRSGYTVLEAGNGCEAVAIFKAHPGPIHLLLTDVVMPKMGGRELAERLTAACPGLRVLFVSGYTSDAVFRHGVQENYVHFLPKPFTPTSLAQKVRDVLDSSR